jgi:hypothetical protein
MALTGMRHTVVAELQQTMRHTSTCRTCACAYSRTSKAHGSTGWPAESKTAATNTGAMRKLCHGTYREGDEATGFRIKPGPWPVSRDPVVWFSLNRRGARTAGRRQSDAAPVFQTEQAGCSDSCHHQILKMPQLHHAFGLTPNE